MGKIINPDNAGKERTRITKAVVLAIRELAILSEPGIDTRDLAAFISLALVAIDKSVEVTVVAWEKRNYWVKADKFRMEWSWAAELATKMREAVLVEDWGKVAQIATQVAQRLSKVTVAPKNRLGRPWSGAWQELKLK